MIVQFKTEEVQRCIKASKGKFYEVEVCVATTATYGDKFRGVCRHRYFIPLCSTTCSKQKYLLKSCFAGLNGERRPERH